MNRKLNLFTLLIFAYSILICATFKKEQPAGILSNVEHKLLEKELKPIPLSTEKVTASASELHHAGQ